MIVVSESGGWGKRKVVLDHQEMVPPQEHEFHGFPMEFRPCRASIPAQDNWGGPLKALCCTPRR